MGGKPTTSKGNRKILTSNPVGAMKRLLRFRVAQKALQLPLLFFPLSLPCFSKALAKGFLSVSHHSLLEKCVTRIVLTDMTCFVQSCYLI